MAMVDKNLLLERYWFHERCQRSEETLHSFVGDVRKLAESCEFNEQADALIRDRIVFGLHNHEVKWRIIHRGGSPSVEEILDECVKFEQNATDEVEEKFTPLHRKYH